MSFLKKHKPKENYKMIPVRVSTEEKLKKLRRYLNKHGKEEVTSHDQLLNEILDYVLQEQGIELNREL